MHSETTAAILGESFSSSDSRKSALIQFLLLEGLVLILYAPVIRGLVQQWWDDPNYGHGLLVPLFVAYLLWRDRSRWLSVPLRPSDYGLPILWSALGLLLLGTLGAELFTARMSFILMISGIIVLLAGWQFLRSIAFPIGYLTFMIPLPALVYYQLTFPLQLLASRLGAWGLVHLGIPTMRQGNLLILPNVTLEVVEACSGVRSLLSLVAAVVAYGYLAERSNWKRALLVALTIPIVILSNGFRLVAAGVLSYVYGPNVDSGALHAALGLLFFVLAFLSILAIHSALRHFTRSRTSLPVQEG